MATIHRKLFPTNVTDCQAYPCDPSCPSAADCYPYPYPPDPDFFFPLPPPPPPLSSSSSSSLILSPYIIIFLSLLATVFILVISYVVFVKQCYRRRPRQLSEGSQDFLDHNLGPQIDHPIWYINSIGLQPSVINSIAIFKYKKGNAPIEGSNCPICLSEFSEDETLRLLPKCNHAFHIACIDTWLRSHTNCPLCRAGIMSNSSRVPTNESRSQTTTLNNDVDARGDSDIEQNIRGETEVVIGITDSKENSDSSIVNMARENGRRSVSMDSFSNDNVVNYKDDDNKYNNFASDRARDNADLTVGSSSSEESLHMSSISMKRSFSCSGRFFSSSRYNNSKASSSILPF